MCDTELNNSHIARMMSLPDAIKFTEIERYIKAAFGKGSKRGLVYCKGPLSTTFTSPTLLTAPSYANQVDNPEAVDESWN
ncbi:unnamed protein product [Acanthocheilonema viteae]|uniref:Uncharacterized protein n=1 Tax=Acanthocheilonema viteae TaxID=6277 RepID=A0A498S9A0_ACAVI|nr:unnamed protein product [Acanthocheilonema viteae]